MALSINVWEKTLFDALGARRSAGLDQIGLTFIVLGVATVVLAVVDLYARETLAIRWRGWLTTDYVARWMTNDRYLEIERVAALDNPDQRIAEDLRMMVGMTVDLMIGFVSAVASMMLFGAVLWERSAPAVTGNALPGDLVWYAIGYALFGSMVVLAFGPSLVRRAMRQQRYEADFRFLLVAVRRGAERIAAMGMAPVERRRLGLGFDAVRHNFMALLRVRTGLRGVTSVLDTVTGIVPLIVRVPRYFDGIMTLGDVVQARGAFITFTVALSWFIQSFPQLAELTATVNRIYAFDRALDAPPPMGIVHETAGAGVLETVDLRIDRPDGQRLIDVGNWVVGPGERWLIRGASGVGKSILMKALAGHWRHGTGLVRRGAPTVMMLSHNPYLPRDSIRALLGNLQDDAACRRALADVGLADLADMLDHVADWQALLSSGEQQCLAIARIIVSTPDLVILDEATNSIDPDRYREICRVFDTLKGVSIISTSHDPVCEAVSMQKMATIEGKTLNFTADRT